MKIRVKNKPILNVLEFAKNRIRGNFAYVF
jgi:hypothetical protein